MANENASWGAILFQGVAKPLLYVFAPSLVLVYYQVHVLQERVQGKFPALYALANQWCIYIIAVALVIPVAVHGCDSVRSLQRRQTDLGHKALGALLLAVGNVVGVKAIRFGDLVKQTLKEGKVAGAKVFDTITQPDTQIDALVGATHEIFRQLYPHAAWRVSLIEVKDGRTLDKFGPFYPKNKDPRIAIEELCRPDSCASRAVEKGIAIVEDLRAELRKPEAKRSYRTTRDRMEEEGSMLSYAVVHRPTRVVAYILTICADKKDVVATRDKDMYQEILEKISERISLEYSLKILKDRVKGIQT